MKLFSTQNTKIRISDIGQFMTVRYIINGLFATSIHYIALTINIEIYDMKSAGIANFIAALFGISISFLGNRYYVFRSRNKPFVNQSIMFFGLSESLSIYLP